MFGGYTYLVERGGWEQMRDITDCMITCTRNVIHAMKS